MANDHKSRASQSFDWGTREDQGRFHGRSTNPYLTITDSRKKARYRSCSDTSLMFLLVNREIKNTTPIDTHFFSYGSLRLQKFEYQGRRSMHL